MQACCCTHNQSYFQTYYQNWEDSELNLDPAKQEECASHPQREALQTLSQKIPFINLTPRALDALAFYIEAVKQDHPMTWQADLQQVFVNLDAKQGELEKFHYLSAVITQVYRDFLLAQSHFAPPQVALYLLTLQQTVQEHADFVATHPRGYPLPPVNNTFAPYWRCRHI